jgi:hypothetical protein
MSPYRPDFFIVVATVIPILSLATAVTSSYLRQTRSGVGRIVESLNRTVRDLSSANLSPEEFEEFVEQARSEGDVITAKNWEELIEDLGGADKIENVVFRKAVEPASRVMIALFRWTAFVALLFSLVAVLLCLLVLYMGTASLLEIVIIWVGAGFTFLWMAFQYWFWLADLLNSSAEG